ncbi:MAG: GAF domain-containing protein [Fibromonadaceae bacterium]|jgi:signal transduction histidine kinase/CheY-like chemotaxis protein/PAS domain-containing protein/HPt (histidine-containing phosphotransfer) domain-containing protein|nr:GAF domain-containing protein [Fibromonadaceae bacterium]
MNKKNKELSSLSFAADALNKAIKTFTTHAEKFFKDVIAEGLRPIAEATDLDNIIIYKSIKMAKGQYGQFYKWDKKTGGTAPLDDTLKILPPSSAIEQWFAALLKGELVIRRQNKMSKDELKFSKIFGIKAIVLVPVFTRGEFWGTVTFQDHEKERDFDDCIDLLSSVAYLCANAVIREEMQQQNIRTVKMLETLNEASMAFISQSEESFEKRMTTGVGLICDMVGLDRMSIWRNFTMPNGLHASQVYRWDRESGGTTNPTPGLEDLTYAKFAPRWERIFANNEMPNGPVKLMPEAAVLESFGVVSALVVPLFIKNNFWGFALFEDRHHERYFEEELVKIMHSAAFLCANIIINVEMEHKILEANKISDMLLNEASIGIVVYNKNAEMIDCNAKTLEMFNCTKQHFLKHFYELSPKNQPDGRNSEEKARESIKQMLREGRVSFEWLHKSTSGELIPCEITLASTIHMGINMGLGYIYDLRKIKSMEAIASEAQEMTKAIIEASPVAYVLCNEKFKVIDCNTATLQLFACPDKQYLLDNYFGKLSSEEQVGGLSSFDKAKIAMSKTFTEGKHSFEWIHKTLNCELLPVEVTQSPFVFKGKKYVISFLYDLSNHRKMLNSIFEQSKLLALRLEQQKLISDISKNFVAYGDSYTLINEALSKLGWHLDVSRIFIFYMDYEGGDTHVVYQWYSDENVPELQGNNSYNLFGIIKSTFPRKLPEGVAPIISCTDVNTALEKFHIFKSMGVTSFMSVPLYVEGNLWGVISAEHCFMSHEWPSDETSFFTTISSIIAGAIMRSIYDAKLKESLNKVTNLSKAKDDFLSKISHEIRTPMNAILGITEIQLQGKNLPAAARDGLSIIRNSGDSLLRIINDLLDLSKIEAKKLEIVLAKYEMASLISDSTQMNMPRIKSKPIEFRLKIDENIPTELIGDELRIKQILNNILSNAFKYTSSGEVLLSIFAEKNKDENFDVMLIFKISDTGQGMTKEQSRKIFDEYFRFNLGVNHLVEGTGLGMTITQNLVHLMGGEISVESELGKGSVFTINLPQKTAGNETLGKELAESLQKFRISNSSQIKKMQIVRDPMPYGKVLIVDDVESNLYVAKHILAPYDLSIDTAMSGFEAIDKINSGEIYDIVFMDHMMPKMDGIETVRKMRDFGYAHTIIALTANAVVGQLEIFLRNGFDGFISKPIDFIKLNDVLNKFIRDKQPIEVIEKARSQKTELENSTQILPEVDSALLSIFAKDTQKSLLVLEETLKNIAAATDEDLRLFTVHVHAMKSNLANIHETETSELALHLEKAGKQRNKDIILAKTPQLIDVLRKMVEKIEKKSEENKESAEEDTAYLCEQLKAISDACASYDARSANIALAKLGEMLWTNKTKNVIEQISKHILFSEFEEADSLAANYNRKF